jgi:hypothetical protein
MTWLVMALLAASPTPFDKALEKRCPGLSQPCVCEVTLGDPAKALRFSLMNRALLWVQEGCGPVPDSTPSLGACEEHRNLFTIQHTNLKLAKSREDRAMHALNVGMVQSHLMGCIVGELNKKRSSK